VVHWDVRIQMAGGVTATLTPGRDSTKFIGTEGWVQVGRSSGITTHPESMSETKLADEDARLVRSQRHDQNFIEAVKNRKGAVTSVAEAVRSDAISHLSNIAVRLGRKVVWDPKQEAILGDPEASKKLRGSPVPTLETKSRPSAPGE
jgi:glucose-fructose oxidoreductase